MARNRILLICLFSFSLSSSNWISIDLSSSLLIPFFCYLQSALKLIQWLFHSSYYIFCSWIPICFMFIVCFSVHSLRSHTYSFNYLNIFLMAPLMLLSTKSNIWAISGLLFMSFFLLTMHHIFLFLYSLMIYFLDILNDMV